MLEKKLVEILDFAIDNEKKAVKFYQKLQEMVKFSNQKKMLLDLQKMEEGHVIAIQNIKNGESLDFEVKDIEDLKISDYLVEKEFSEDADFQDILIVAMKREEASKKLYEDLANKLDKGNVKKLFRKLAQDEAEHKLQFEKLYNDKILTNN